MTMIAHHFETAEQQREAQTLGMWLFLVTEIMFFGGLFASYAVYRYLYPEAFATASGALDVMLGAINTAVLLCSSLTMAFAVHGANTGSRSETLGFLAATIVLGSTFVGIKGVEYHHKFEHGLVPGPHFRFHPAARDGERAGAEAVLATPAAPPAGGAHTHPAAAGSPPRVEPWVRQVQLFFGMYFVMTGLHAFHMLVGIAVLGVLVWRTLASSGIRFATGIELAGLYWHFVDVVWVFLYPLLYLIDRSK
jgi:cytochrome c oxidase subunit 3